MGNLTTSFKKFLQNKNTVTVVGVVVAIIVLYVAYTMRIKSSINPINVPYATEQISAGTQITESQVSTRQVPPSMIDDNVITNVSDIIDKYASADTVIPEGSLFYKSAVVEKEQLPDNIILDYPKNYVLYKMDVNIDTTYGNSMYPGNYIDIWFTAVNKVTDETDESQKEDADKVMYGRLLSNVKILAVRDSSGKAVFQNLDESRTPSMVIVALPEDYYILLSKAERMNSYSTDLIPVPTNESLKDNPGDVEVSSEDLKNWINERTYWTES